MMDVKVNIDAKDIEAQVVKAIVETSFGANLKKAIDEALNRMGSSYSYDNELKKWVEQKMRSIAMDYVEKNFTTQIEDSIRTWLTSEKLKSVTDQVIGEVVRNLTVKERY